MSVLREEIDARVSAYENNGETCSGDICFDADFSGFKGHFPGKPIVPGVCMVQAVAVLVARALGSRVTIAELLQAKFVSVAEPGANVRIVAGYTQRDPLTYLVKASLTLNGEALAKIEFLADLADREA